MSITVDLNPETILTVSSDSDLGTTTIRRSSNVPGTERDSASLEFREINLNANCSVSIGPFSLARRYIIDDIVGDISYSIANTRINYNNISTGIYTGGAISVNGGDNTKFDIAAGSGVILDSYTNPETPVVTRVTWPAFSANTTTHIAADFTSYVGIDRGGNIQQFVGPIDPTDKRDVIVLGILVHTGGTFLDSVGEFSTPGYDIGNIIGDLANSIGYINIEGNIYGADSTNLEVAKSSGSSFVLGGNFQTSAKSPNIITNGALSAPYLFKPYQDGAGGFTLDFPLTQDVDPNNYDDGSGTLASVPAQAQWQIQRIYSGTTNDDVIVAYGQNTYLNKNTALANINTEEHVKNPVLRDTLLRGFLVVKKGATDLSDTGEAVFIAADKFGQVAAEGAQLIIPSGIATTTTSAKTGAFTANLNKAYQVDNSSGAIVGTLAEATDSTVGNICECWVMDDASTYNFSLKAPTEASTINGTTGGGGQVAQANVTSANSNYKKISVTVLDTDVYLIDGVDSVTLV